jgi:hypothetical protein
MLFDRGDDLFGPLRVTRIFAPSLNPGDTMELEVSGGIGRVNTSPIGVRTRQVAPVKWARSPIIRLNRHAGPRHVVEDCVLDFSETIGFYGDSLPLPENSEQASVGMIVGHAHIKNLTLRKV